MVPLQATNTVLFALTHRALLVYSKDLDDTC
jgi:hypothetical protein